MSGNVEVFYALDLDRTLLDTVALAETYREAVDIYDPVLAALLREKVDESVRIEQSFSMRDFVVDQEGEPIAQIIERTFLELASLKDGLLNPGAREILSYVAEDPNASAGILTYGSILGQATKIAAVGLGHIPHLITQQKHKGELISTWKQETGGYLLPQELGGLATRELVFVDDKALSFQGLPRDVVGYWIKGPYATGGDILPSNVLPVASLDEVYQSELDRRSVISINKA